MSDQFTASSSDEFTSSGSSTFSAGESTETPAPEQPVVSHISVYTPVIYITVILVCFMVFSVFYRRRKVQKLTSMQPLFGENRPKEIYLQLKAQTDPKVHEKVLKAALIRRGAEALRRMFKLKECEPFINLLYLKGYIGDDDHERLKIQKKLQELELNELAMEAESYKRGWAQTFFPACQETTMNEALRRRVNSEEERQKLREKKWSVRD